MSTRIVVETSEEKGQVYFRAAFFAWDEQSPRRRGRHMRSVDGALMSLSREMRPEDLRAIVTTYKEEGS